MSKIFITGGAGFIGTNTALYYLAHKHQVTIFDNLSRPGSKKNLMFIQKKYPQVRFRNGDIRDKEVVREVVEGADIIFHFAGQVAVTTSVVNPREDFEINALGTLNVLEAARLSRTHPVVINSSTNKVYGDLPAAQLRETATRYEFRNRPFGIGESEPLDFHSPYGCSKGAGDQYVRDYARIYGLKTIVFRQSCIYGIHQNGIEDQGWVAWILKAAINKEPITIYGNGKQVRDILYIDDLIEAYDSAISNINVTSGQIYNIGGGLKNSISIWQEFRPILEQITGNTLDVTYKTERPGDQKIFIADTRKAEQDFGWKPKVSVHTGLMKLAQWLKIKE